MSNELDGVWKALSDPTRRAILDLLRERPRTTTEIVESFPNLTRFGVMKHIDVLRKAGLINTREEGRQRTILFCLSGHGHFDLSSYESYLTGKLQDYEYPGQDVARALAEI